MGEIGRRRGKTTYKPSVEATAPEVTSDCLALGSGCEVKEARRQLETRDKRERTEEKRRTALSFAPQSSTEDDRLVLPLQSKATVLTAHGWTRRRPRSADVARGNIGADERRSGEREHAVPARVCHIEVIVSESMTGKEGGKRGTHRLVPATLAGTDPASIPHREHPRAP